MKKYLYLMLLPIIGILFILSCDPEEVDLKPPTVTITSPEDRAVFSYIQSIYFSCSIEDDFDESFPSSNVIWESNVDGFLSYGTSIIHSLSVANHWIKVSATDHDDMTGVDSIKLIITSDLPPEVIITNPDDSSVFFCADIINFNGTINDTTISDSEIEWSSSMDGVFGHGTNIQTNSLSAGKHSIYLTAIDSIGLIGIDSIEISIGVPPQVIITSPSDGSSFVHGEAVSLSGNVSDENDGVLPDSAIEWNSSIDGFLGNGTDITIYSLSIGEHMIALLATNSVGLSSKDSVLVNIELSQPPTVSITSPSNGSDFELGDMISFSGSVIDDIDEVIPDANIEWQSSIDGFLGFGSNISNNSLSVGTHRITLNATDSDGNLGADSIQIEIGQLELSVVASHVVSSAHSIFVREPYLYLAGDEVLVNIVNIANPLYPYDEGYLDTIFSGCVRDIFMQGTFAYVTASNNGLRIIDVSVPSAPIEIAFIDSGYARNASSIFIVDSVAYISQQLSLWIIDVSDPYYPSEISYENFFGAGSNNDIFVSGSFAYFLQSPSGLKVIDVSNPANPIELGYIDIETAGAQNVFVSGSYAYIADDTNNLLVIDVSNPSYPIEIGRYEFGARTTCLFASGSYVYVGCTTASPDYNCNLKVLDVSDPSNPLLVANCDLPDGWPTDVAVSGFYAFVARSHSTSSIEIVDVSMFE